MNTNIIYDVSIVSVTMNRHDNLISSLHTWLELPIKEIIIIDWCSDNKIEEFIPTYLKLNKNYKIIKFYYVEGFNTWVLTWAFNLGFNLATSEYILKIDADIIIDNNFFNLNIIPDNKLIFFRGCWQQSNEMYINGQFFIKNTRERLDLIIFCKKETRVYFLLI
jgi:glycosyltransferase involved in cell wall biosynthesis